MDKEKLEQHDEQGEIEVQSNNGDSSGAVGNQAPPVEHHFYHQHEMPHVAYGYHMMNPGWVQMMQGIPQQGYAYNQVYG